MPDEIPLCVDLEGALLKTDPLWESVLLCMKGKPLELLRIPLWALRGRARLQLELDRRVSLNMAALPVNTGFLSHLRQEHDRGRRVILVSSGSATQAEMAAKHFGIFAIGIGGDNGVLTREQKIARLQNDLGAKIDYADNAREFGASRFSLGEFVQALRVHQWAKNLLLFAALAGSHHLDGTRRLFPLLVAFAAFCLCASSVYIFNDLLDLESDRHHPQKRNRPFAAGNLPLLAGVIGSPVLLLLSALLALTLPWSFCAAFATYYLLTVLYSCWLKQIVILDVQVLAALYTIRVIAGGLAAGVIITDWLLAFSMFLFISLAFAKRFTELQWARLEKKENLKGRGYRTNALELVGSMGVACGYLAVLVLAFYITNPDVTKLYQKPNALWLACPVLLYWISRVWLLAHRQLLHDDPVVFALKDKQSWIICLLLLLIAMAASPL